MASIFQRGKSYHVIYTFEDIDGSKKQKWEAFKTLTEAKRRKTEIEYQQNIGTFTIPSCHTLDELLNEYVNLYGKTVWSLSMYRSNTGLIKNYISPMIGSLSLHEITPHVIERYYQTLLKTRAVPKKTQKKFSNEITYVQPPTIKKIHNLLRSAFNQALKWDMVERNPVTLASKPSYQAQKRDIWDAETLFHAIEICPDERLKLCINLAFACSLRMGEILGLTWDCLDLSEYSVNNGIAWIKSLKTLLWNAKQPINIHGDTTMLSTLHLGLVAMADTGATVETAKTTIQKIWKRVMLSQQ